MEENVGSSKFDLEKTITDLEQTVQDLEEKNQEVTGAVRIWNNALLSFSEVHSREIAIHLHTFCWLFGGPIMVQIILRRISPKEAKCGSNHDKYLWNEYYWIDKPANYFPISTRDLWKSLLWSSCSLCFFSSYGILFSRNFVKFEIWVYLYSICFPIACHSWEEE